MNRCKLKDKDIMVKWSLLYECKVVLILVSFLI